MRKPDDIPQDVWEEAEFTFQLATSMFPLPSSDELFPTGIAFIAFAILSERERCARVCKTEAGKAKAKGLDYEARGAGWCAAAVRKGDAA